jgi:hypothetical protein
VNVPDRIGAVEFALEVTRGVVRAGIVAAHGLFTGYYAHVHPSGTGLKGTGTYRVVLPNPGPGTWAFSVVNDSTGSRAPWDTVPGDDGDADYSVTMRLLQSSIATTTTTRGQIVADITNAASSIVEPVLEASPGYLTSHRGSFRRNGLPNVIDIEVPRDTATLSVQLRSEGEGTNAELRLYDCTTGECFSDNIGVPAARAHTLVVRKPNAGRWVAAVNAAPFPAATGSFVLDELVTTGTPVRRTSAAARASGARWQETIDKVAAPPPAPGKTPIVLLELIDAAIERAHTEYPWSRTPRFMLRDRPVAIGTAIYRP